MKIVLLYSLLTYQLVQYGDATGIMEVTDVLLVIDVSVVYMQLGVYHYK